MGAKRKIAKTLKAAFSHSIAKHKVRRVIGTNHLTAEGRSKPAHPLLTGPSYLKTQPDSVHHTLVSIGV
jgi:hypothetical protein